MTNSERIDQTIANIYKMFPREQWQPTQTHPVAVIHERRNRENRLNSMATQVQINGGKVRKDYIDG
jgi:hypothetical protein